MQSQAQLRTFEVTADHLALARRMIVGWCGDEFGAPEIDPKRPYGNSDVIGDIAEILKMPRDQDGEVRPANAQYACTLHREMETVLQIVLATGAFEAGVYAADRYSRDWRPYRPPIDEQIAELEANYPELR